MSFGCSLKLRLRQLLLQKLEKRCALRKKKLYLKAMVHLEIVNLFLIGSALQVFSTTVEIPNPLNGKHLLIHALEVFRLLNLLMVCLYGTVRRLYCLGQF